MEHKTFDLMTKMYSEFSEFRKEMSEFKNEMTEFKNETKNDIIRLENKIDTNSKALLDDYKQTYEKLTEIEKKVDSLYTKIEKQEVEIKVIKGGKM